MYKTEIRSITDISLSELEALCSSIGDLPTGRNKYFPGFMKGATAFDEMSNLSKDFRNQLEEKYQVFRTKLIPLYHHRAAWLLSPLQGEAGNYNFCMKSTQDSLPPPPEGIEETQVGVLNCYQLSKSFSGKEGKTLPIKRGFYRIIN